MWFWRLLKLLKEIYSLHIVKKNNGNSKLFNNINEIKYEDFIDIVNKYVPSISKFLSENIYNFKNGMAKEVMNVFLTKLFNWQKFKKML